MEQKLLKTSLLAVAVAAASGAMAQAQESNGQVLEEVLVKAKTTYGNNVVSEAMLQQQTPFTSVNAVIDTLPGVSVNEGDVYGFDDWSTSITVRGFSTNLSEQQVGTTIDGIPNGGSNYGGGAKANRYVDPANLRDADVSLGTADIASRSLEALGGTINYMTATPEDEAQLRAQLSVGEFDARRGYLRYDTGLIGGNTRAWVSYSFQDATDWDTQTAENERDHFAAKLVSSFERLEISGYLSYDDIQEDNYQRVYSEAQFDAIPDADGLTGVWTGVPFEDQLFRQGWSTLRENLLGYVNFDFDLNEDLNIKTSLYHHQNEGRGDWLPPYLIDATPDGGPQSEFLGGTVATGELNVDTSDRIFFVDAAGNELAPDPNCVPSYTVENWYGVLPSATAQQIADPSCYPDGAVAVQSFRNTHYEKDRTGLSIDLTWDHQVAGMDNQIRGGIWYEDQTRDEFRDWHNVDTRSGFSFNAEPYYIQYDRTYPQEVFKWYLQDSLTTDALTWTLGIKRFSVEVDREDNFDPSLNTGLESDSDTLFSGGVVWETPVDGLEAFAGYSENFKALNDLILERPAADFESIEPETSETMEVGLRYSAGRLRATAVYFQNDFENRIIFLGADTIAGPDFAIGTNGTFFNAGGIESQGFELAVDFGLTDSLNAYVAYSYNDATYLGTGDTTVDGANGIVPGNRVAGIPENMFVAALDWASGSWNAGVSAKYTGDREVNQSNTWTADAFTITDLYAGVSLDDFGNFLDDLRLDLVVNNLFDEEYLGTIASNAAWIGGPRTYALTLTADF
ncbi:MAG: TonB-dependent receptor [Pseudomonadota bacterium]